jgi:hypothetical protein
MLVCSLQESRDLRAGKPRIGDHSGADDMAESGEPAAIAEPDGGIE